MLFRSMFPGTKGLHLDRIASDNKALCISPEGMDCSFQKPFRFEQMWMSDKGCSETIEAVWSENSFEPWDTRVLKKMIDVGRSCPVGVGGVLAVSEKS